MPQTRTPRPTRAPHMRVCCRMCFWLRVWTSVTSARSRILGAEAPVMSGRITGPLRNARRRHHRRRRRPHHLHHPRTRLQHRIISPRLVQHQNIRNVGTMTITTTRTRPLPKRVTPRKDRLRQRRSWIRSHHSDSPLEFSSFSSWTGSAVLMDMETTTKMIRENRL